MALAFALSTFAQGAEDNTSFAGRSVAIDPADTAIPLTDSVRRELDPDARFSLGLDRYVREDYEAIAHRRVLVATSRLALDSEGRHLLETLLPQRKPIVRRIVLFNDELPEGARSRAIENVLSRYPEVRVFERTPANFRPTAGMMEDVDVVLVDIPMRGGRFHPETAFLAAILEEASMRDIPVIVLDRPIPLDTLDVDGPAGGPSVSGTADAYFPLFPFPGLTGGELALLFNTHYGVGANLTMVDMLGWRRGQGYEPLEREFRSRGFDPRPLLPEWDAYASSGEDSRWRALAQLLPEASSPQVRPAAGGNGFELVLTGPATEGFCDRLMQYDPTITTCTPLPEGGGVVLGGPAPRAMAEDATRIWAALAAKDPAILPPAKSPGKLGLPEIFEGLRAGRDPRELIRLWQVSQAFRETKEHRDKVLRYGR